MNLASNAKTAMPDGGSLDMELKNIAVDGSPEFDRVREAGLVPGPYVELRITDTGVGMDDAVRNRIFEQSFTTGADKGGSGLGLATVYSIVKASGGAILVDSTLGQGTTFRVYFPSATSTDRRVVASPIALDEMRGDETILLIEDQESVRHATRAILELHGYRVVEAEGRTEARAVVAHMLGDLDLILSDVMLTDGNGPEIVEEVLRQRPQLPVLYMSGFASDDVLAQRSLSIDAPVLAKPFTPSEICYQVRRLLNAK
jgi:two-component system cell cycle sensor histidine kinase/response regulator CckA